MSILYYTFNHCFQVCFPYLLVTFQQYIPNSLNISHSLRLLTSKHHARYLTNSIEVCVNTFHDVYVMMKLTISIFFKTSFIIK